MKTMHLSNREKITQSMVLKLVAIMIGLALLFLFLAAPSINTALISLFVAVIAVGMTYHIMRKAYNGFTLTPTHLQQHRVKGGWVLSWHNIERIGQCEEDVDGWRRPLPWIGIKIRDYSPFVESICPRLAVELLMEQRALLYVGVASKNREKFQDLVLDSKHYQVGGRVFKGLQATVANRMDHMRAAYGYDIFIAEGDLDRPLEEFIGLSRRYLASADSIERGQRKDTEV
ncbi:DUF2982 domain-containing protein [Vibrio astriarenae]|uniref:DUF2982 domain-containing protein n=1 Tax=Vibrio astriarenae TaxID=1481923 RepID=A0A7Z2T256_9VIBR|nr:DUF2982 domain-containing protein [Vibrio astriarenae]QIA62983.1 DUF2982 domain-containing protein [Vibrio astriarenae]